MTLRKFGNGIAAFALGRYAAWMSRRKTCAQRLCILKYHRVLQTPDLLLGREMDAPRFSAQMDMLARHFNVLPMDEALARRAAGTLPPLAVAITFDDGYRSVHDIALPILMKHGLPATIFIATGCLESGCLWNDQVVRLVRACEAPVLDLTGAGLGMYPVANLLQKQEVVAALIAKLKYLPWSERKAVVAAMTAQTQGVAPDELMLTREHVQALARQGMEIGAHTVTHPILTMVSDAEADQEIRASKQALESMTQKPVRYFAYPNGKWKIDYDDRHVQMVKSAGYEAAYTTVFGPAHLHSDAFQLPRSLPWDENPHRFAARLMSWFATRYPALDRPQ